MIALPAIDSADDDVSVVGLHKTGRNVFAILCPNGSYVADMMGPQTVDWMSYHRQKGRCPT